MASLDDFTDKSSATLDDLQIQAPFVPVSNKPSNVNLAAYTASLSENPESVEANYLQAASQLEGEEASSLVDDVRKKARAYSQEVERPALGSILADPSLSDEQKQAAADAYLDENSSLYNLRNIVSAEALIADVDGETEESSEARINFSHQLQAVNDYHRRKQIALNRELSAQDPSMLEVGAGFLEIMAPYVEQGITGKTLSAIRDGDKKAYVEAFSLMGSTKEEIANNLKKVPPSERGLLIEKTVDAINNNSSIVFPDENDFVRMDFLRTALEEGYYGEGDKWIDNTISLLELAGLPVGIFKNISRASRLTRAGKRVENATEEVVEETVAASRTEEPNAATAPDGQLRAAEDASEARIRNRQAELEADPVRRAEDSAERRTEARRAVMSDDNSLRAAEDAQEARMQYVRSSVKPVSLSQNYRNTNPTKARAAYTAAAEDRTGQAADALYGTSRLEAVAHDNLPEIPRPGGKIQNKVSLPDSNPRPLPPNPRVMDSVADNGAIYLSDAVKAQIATKVINDLNNAKGLVTRNEMVVPDAEEIGEILHVGVTYGPRDNGWASGKDAFDRVKESTRDYGLTDKDLTLLRREGDDYVPVKVEEATEGGDYLVKASFPYRLNASDVTLWDTLTTKWNVLDRMTTGAATRGTFNQHVMDAASNFDPLISLGASASVDKSSYLEKVLSDLGSVIGKGFNKLPRGQKKAFESEVKRANHEGYNKGYTQLVAEGFKEETLTLLKQWKEYWDTVYWLENRVLADDLRNRGYKLLEDSTGDSRLFAKGLHKNHAGANRRVYNPETGKMETLSDSALKELYEGGGEVARLRSSFKEGDELVEHIVVKNNPGGPYLRKIRDDDQILNYREGYYTVYYGSPKFITKREKIGNSVKTSTIATAGDVQSADRMVKRLQQEADEGVEYFVRDDKNRMKFDGDDNWSLQESTGRTAQRVRGERLVDASAPNVPESHNNILGPVDSLIRSTRSISNRLPMRGYLEATKQRGINQFKEVFPTDKFGQPVFPRDPSQVKAGEASSKLAADAKTLVAYVRFLEEGYANSIDDGWKAMMMLMADVSGRKGLTRTEKAARFASEMGPTGLSRNTAFTLYLALNPLRQFIVQSHQAIQLVGLNPKYAIGELPKDMAAFLSIRVLGSPPEPLLKVSGRSKEELMEMWEDYQKSGLAASIDKQNLVDESLTQIADATSAGGFRRNPVARAVGRVSQGIAISRKIGYDAGEELNMMSAWLTWRDLELKRLGKTKLTTSETVRAGAKARSFTYNMNRAGKQPYTANELGLVFQFMEVPHKAFLQMVTNRNLTVRQKVQMATFNLVMYGGPPTALLTAYFEPWLPEEGELREAVLQGMESYTFNKLASVMYGEEVGIDLSSVAAVDNAGIYEFLAGLWTTDAGRIVASSPAGSLVSGPNPRITNFARTAAEFFHFTEPKDGSIATAGELMQSFINLSSGGANLSKAFKAKMVDGYAKKYNSRGGITDPNVTTPESVATAFGFGTLAEARKYWASDELYKKREAHDKDAKEWFRLVAQELTREGITADEREYAVRVMNLAAEQFKDSPRAYGIVEQQLKYMVQEGNLALFDQAIDATEWMKTEDARRLINNLPVDPEKKQQARETLDFIDKYRSDW